MRAVALAILAVLALVPLAPPALAEDLIPARRLVLTEGVDLPGGDIAKIFDTTLDACERACLTNLSCDAFTFNTRNGSCFPKSGPGEGAPYQGAYSGRVLTADPAVVAASAARRGELTFVADWELPGIRAVAETLANEHVTNGWSAEEHLASAAEAEAQGDFLGASRFAGAALNLTDSAAGWEEYARLLLAAGQTSDPNARSFRERAYFAAVNAYLRASDPALRHSILLTMGAALEGIDRGPDTVRAYRLAQSLQPRDDTAALLSDAAGKYGFRIAETLVESDSARPRICATFSEDLVKSGVDYESFVQLPAPDLTVTSDGWRQLCVEGVAHGQRVTVTFREGLPAADGQVLAANVAITQYIRDRSPGVRFPGRSYVLPRAGGAAIPVQTVNATTLDLTLYRVTDRNLLRAIQNQYFGTPIQDWQEGYFSTEMGEEVWSGTATVAQEVNRDVTTRLPMDEALASQPAGIFVLRAAVPGVDPYVSPAGWQWFVASDLGLTTLSGVDGLTVVVRSLGTAGAKPGARVELLNAANAVLGATTTNDQGLAHFDAGLTRGTGASAPALIVVRDGETDIAFLSLTDPEFDLSDRGVEGREPAPPVDVFLTTDRGAYRAGEIVRATALTRDTEAAAITGLPLTAILTRPDGVEYSRALAPDAGQGGHVFALPIAGAAPRGVWRMEVFADVEADALASTTFLVEDFLPERIDFTAMLPDGPLMLGETPELTIEAKYLFGAPGADLAIEGEVLLRSAQSLEKWPGYVFGRHDEPFSAILESFGGERTDAAGEARFPIALPEVADPLRPLEARVTVRVAEGSGRPVERRITRLLSPSAPVIGVKPMFDQVVPEGSDARFSLIGVGAGEAAAPMTVAWTITRIETQYQWYQSYGQWNWEPVVTRKRVAEGTADLANQPVEISAPVQWGEYEIAVERTDGQLAATSTTFFAGWYAPADTSTTPDTLELSLDKPAYRPGETAQLRVVPRAAGTALIAVLSNRVIEMKAVEVKEGENLIPLAVTDDWGAGVYVTASVLRPMDVAAGRNPARALGLAYAAIDPGTRALQATVEVAAEADPRGPLPVAVKVAGVEPGNTAFVTIAAVDQGILNLTGFKAPDPQAWYFGQRKLGVGIRDIYGRLIDPMNGAEGTVRSGGDAGAQARLQAPPPTEELVAYFSGPLQVGADGYARTTFDLPAFNGTVKVMAVAWSQRGVGQANADVLVRDPVVVTASVPRFLAPGDTSRLLLEIVHATGPSGRMGLDVSSDGLTLGQGPSGFDLGDKAKATFQIPITAGATGNQTIRVALTTPDGKQLTKVLTIPVQVNDPEIARVTRLDLTKGQSFTFDQDAFAGMLPGTGKAVLAVGPIARLNAPGILAALDRYPYGCTEQMASKALPLLTYDQIAQAMDLASAEGIQTRVQEAITEILMNQGAEGGFGLWAPGSGDFWLDAFVTDFLSRSRARGYEVPDLAFRNALSNLRNQVNYSPDFDAATNGGGTALAYALMVLAREGAAAVGDLRYYADVKGDDFATPLAQAQLGAALAAYGDQTRADAMFRKAAAKLGVQSAPETEQIFRADYGTQQRDAAGVLALATEAGSQAVDMNALTDRLAGRTTGLSTQEATWMLQAASALIDGPGTQGLTLDGQPLPGPLVKVLDGNALTPVVVTNDGAPTTLTVTAYGIPSEPEPAGGNGYAIARSYYTLDGEETTLDQVTVGDRLVAVLDITPFARGEGRLMVTDPLPAGFEIDNPNLLASGAVSALDWLSTETAVAHAEFRQDKFMAAIDRFDSTPFQLAYVVRAISPGAFHHPAASVEDMYRPDFRGRSDAGTVTIGE